MKRLIEEWHPQNYIIMALPHKKTDWNYIFEEVIKQYNNILETFIENDVRVIILSQNPETDKHLISEKVVNNIFLIKCDFNDTWTRDYIFLSLEENNNPKTIDFGFNGWGLKFAADKDNLVNAILSQKGFINREKYSNQREFILEGGSIESDGKGLILTTTRCLCSPNRNGCLDKKEAGDELLKRLGAKKVLFLDYGYLEGDDTDSHIDTLARLIPGNRIVFTGCQDPDDSHYEELNKMKQQLEEFTNLEDQKFELIELPLPDPIFDEEGNRLPATYANFLFYNKKLFLPVYNQPEKDKLAIDILKKALPDYKIIEIDCTTLIKQHGSLHCATMQVPEGFINISFLQDRKEI